MITINTREQMIELKKRLRVREDWHEPDEQEVVLQRMVNSTLDNAHGDESEAHIVLRKDKQHYMINVCDLLAWASEELS